LQYKAINITSAQILKQTKCFVMMRQKRKVASGANVCGAERRTAAALSRARRARGGDD
jgi:hypothetical protein